MDKGINWKSLASPLDVRKVYSPRYFIKKWVSFEVLTSGIVFTCELANGEPIDYYVNVIQNDVIRFRMNPFGLEESKSDMLIESEFAPHPFRIEESEDVVKLVTEKIRVEFPRKWQITAYDQPVGGKVFFSERTDDRAYGPGYEVPPSGFDCSDQDGYCIRESIAVRPGESFYGLGEKFTSMDKWNQEIPLWAVDSGNVSSYRSYKNVPFLISSNGYGLFVHSSFPMVFRMGCESTVTYTIHINHSQLDFFLIYGPGYKHILKQYSQLTGFAPVPPKWSFGFWISKAGYRTRAEVEAVIREMRQRDFPCDVIHLDPWWMGEGPWCNYQWDEEQFPDPAGMIKELKSQGIRTCLWINPYMPKNSELYLEAKKNGFLIQTSAGEVSPVMEAFSGDDLGAVDFTNPKAVAWWLAYLEKLLDQGVAVFKTDFGEQAPVDALYFDGRSGLEMHNIYPLLYNREVFNLTRKKFGKGLVWGRSAYAGSQRYPVQWGGDSYSTLDQLSCQVRALLGYGLSGVPFCSHDVGGFDFSPHFFDEIYEVDFRDSYNDTNQESYPKNAEVYIRWLQVGVFSSHVRAHGKQSREPWTYGDQAEEIARKFLKLRYRLLPYIYNQAVKSSQTGIPMVRPMLLDFQDDPTTQRLDLQYMFGDSILVAPVLTHDGTTDVYLPAGDWVDFWTEKVVSGPKWIKEIVPLDSLPLWVRAGAIVPMGPELDFVEQKWEDPLTIRIYRPGERGELLISDEEKDPIHVMYKREDDQLTVKVSPMEGQVTIQIIAERCVSASSGLTALDLKMLPNGCQVQVDGQNGIEVNLRCEQTV